jgi:hypothetical protein
MTRGTLMWAAAALAGLALAVGVTYAAGTLSSQRIGLSSEPLSAGDRLVPPRAVREPPPSTMRQPVPRPRRPAPPGTTALPSRPSEADDGGRGDD